MNNLKIKIGLFIMIAVFIGTLILLENLIKIL
jgi:hypothetical protein